jgi:alpha-beta hydrolase superfamily lysophospholipase
MRRLCAAMFLTACAMLTACGSGHHEMQATKLAADFSGSGPGTLNDATTLPNLDSRLQVASSLAARITYTSTSGVDDSHPEVTAAVFVPRGVPPQGGWPIVAFGHPATGILHNCAPSQSPTLLDSSKTVAALLDAGYVVTVSDYQGLGLDKTYHPYLDSTTVGNNLIDSVFATRRLVPATSIQWVAMGIAQGGQAAWAADELAENAGRGLNLVGAVSVSPAADIAGLADRAAAGALTNDQKLTLQAYLAALKNEYPDFNLDDYRRGIVRDKWDALLACQGPAAQERRQLADQITADDLRPDGPAAADTLRGFLQKTDLPQGPTAAPMLVLYGGPDPVIPPRWTDQAVDRACKMSDVIQIETRPQSEGADIDRTPAFDWIRNRFNGDPARDDCPSFIANYGASVPVSASTP